MAIVVQAGCSARSVTSAGEVALLSIDGTTYPTAGVALANSVRFTVCVTTTQDVTVRVYLAGGNNAGLAIVTGWTVVTTSSAPYTLQVDGNAAQRVYVTAQASSTTAAVNCDLRAVSP